MWRVLGGIRQNAQVTPRGSVADKGRAAGKKNAAAKKQKQQAQNVVPRRQLVYAWRLGICVRLPENAGGMRRVSRRVGCRSVAAEEPHRQNRLITV